MEKLPENEWAKLSGDELEKCANWEFQRELHRARGLPVQPAWLDLTPKEKAAWRRHCYVAKFGSRMPALFGDEVDVFGCRDEVVEGTLVRSAEILQIGIHWDCSDGAILKGFKEWLKNQRKTNPNARFFKKRGGGNRESALSVLVSIAMLRAHAAGVSRDDALSRLSDLIKKAACGSRFLPKYYREALDAARKMFI